MKPEIRLIDLFETPPARKASSRSNSRMKRAFGSHKDGFWVVTESYLEFRFAVEQEINWRIRRMKSQPERRSYRRMDGSKGWTTPDFLIATDERLEIIECKYKDKVSRYAHRTEELQEIYAQLGGTYRIVTEDDIDLSNEDRGFNALEIFIQRMSDIPYELPFLVAEAFSKHRPETIGDMMEALGGHLSDRRLLYKLHVDGYLSIDYQTGLLGRDTRIAHIRDFKE